MFSKPVLVVSKCLEHGHCRYDGSMISCEEVKGLMPYVEFLPLCPEMAIGLPSPREALRLIDIKGEKRLLMNQSGEDKTEDMLNYVKSTADDLRTKDIDGFILKSRSPSCGIKEVKIYKTIGKAPCINKSAKGFFGEGMIEQFPNLVVEDEGRMTNFDIREHFYTTIFTRAAFKELMKDMKAKALVKFHSDNKYLFMAYSQNQMKVLGKIVANHEKLPIKQVYELYKEQLDLIFKKKPTKGQYTNVILHLFGYFSKLINNGEKAFFLDTLEQYRLGQVPLLSLMSLLKSWAYRFDEHYLTDQRIFEPYPHELIQMRDSGKVV